MKFIFDLATDHLGLPISAVWEYAILGIIGFIACKIGWEVSPGGKWGSEVFWIVSTIAFFALWTVVYAVIWTAKWIYAHWVIVLSTSGIVAFLTVITVVVAHKRKGNDNHA